MIIYLNKELTIEKKIEFINNWLAVDHIDLTNNTVHIKGGEHPISINAAYICASKVYFGYINEDYENYKQKENK